MSSDRFPVYLSPVEEEQFGVRTARSPEVTAANLPSVIAFCRDHGVALLIARCATSDIGAAQAMEKAGFFLTDTLFYHVRHLRKTPIPPVPRGTSVRPVRPGEEESVKAIAAEAFRGYRGHYQADGRLARFSSGEIYSSWAFRSCRARDSDNELMVAEQGGSLVGFNSVKLLNPEEGDLPLAGVLPSAMKRSLIQQAMIIAALHWLRERGAFRCFGSTLIANTVMQKILIRLGFEPHHSSFTFHRWFDR